MAMLAIPIPDNISKILQSIQMEGKLIKKDNSDHCTLIYFEDCLDMEDILKIIPVISDVVKEIKGFNLGVDSYTAFPEGKYGFPIVCKIKNKDLMKMREKIRKALDSNDIKYSTKFKEFIPHITLSYQDEDVKSGKFDEIIWPIKNISLYCGDSNKEKLYVEFPFEGSKEKYSSECLDEMSGYFEKLATL